MRIAILTTQCPFVIGGAELHAASLTRVLREAGHEAEIVSMPFKWYPSATVLDHMLAARSMDVSEFNGVEIDLAICLKFPAYLMRHPNKTFWILHQHRQAYDMWDSGHTDLFNDPNGQLVREAIREADNVELGNARRIFANSANVAKRLRLYNNIEAEPLYHPPPLAGRLRTGCFGDYFYYPSRISPGKRQELVLRSLVLSKGDFRVVFSGAPDNRDYGRSLERRAHELGVADRVEWKGFVSEAEMLDLYAGARGILFAPQDEDLGYIVFEAMLSGKPMITVSDAGEPASLIRNAIEGFVVTPTPIAFASAMDRLAASAQLASTMGWAARQRYDELDISWDKVIAQLLGTRSASGAPSLRRAETVTQRSSVDTQTKPGAVHASTRLSEIHRSSGPPDAASVMSFAQLAERYAMDQHLSGDSSFLEQDWPRYRAGLDAISGLRLKPRRILQIGATEPYVFSVLLRETFPDAELVVAQEGREGRSTVMIHARAASERGIAIDVFSLRLESSPLPFDVGEFDLVVAVDILERLAIDPGFVLLEARRTLRERGILFVLTHNVISEQSISRAIHGLSPYASGGFAPWKGVLGRHNREYTPREVESLGLYVGMETVLLDTVDVRRQTDDLPEGIGSLISQGLPPELRGEQVLYVGLKNASVVMGHYPSSLYSTDPRIFSGELQLEAVPGTQDRFVLRVLNKSPLTWRCEGKSRIRLSVDRIDRSGCVARDVLALPLPHDVDPGSSVAVPIRGRNDGMERYWFEIGLHADGAGAFHGTGRSRTVSVYATLLEARCE